MAQWMMLKHITKWTLIERAVRPTAKTDPNDESSPIVKTTSKSTKRSDSKEP